MPKISGSIPNFANGVSQQAEALRLPSQGQLQVNAYSTIVDGLTKRPPTKHRASLGSSAGFSELAFSHVINRDAYERYLVLAQPGSLRVFDIESGSEKTVNTPDGLGYLSIPEGYTEAPYRAISVADFTFLVNQTKTIELGAEIEPESPEEAIVHVMAGNYGKDYTITINGNEVARYRTPEGNSASQAPAVDVSFIARRLATGEAVTLDNTVNGDVAWVWKATDTSLADNGITPANGWTVKVFKSTIYIKKDNGTEFSIVVDDGYNGNSMKAIKETVQDFANLPAYCEDGVALEITGTPGNEYDNYFVRFVAQNSDTSMGIWKEVPAPGVKVALNAATMPHVLVREADGTFTFKEATWDKRKAGDDDTAPPPSFVGGSFGGLTFFKNRLVFLSGESVIMSRSGSYFDFWRSTATALLDDDPIDIAGVDAGVSVLRSAVAFYDQLILFADQAQFALRGNELLTPKTASIRRTTGFSSSSRAQPVNSGRAVFFPVNRGQYSMVREYMLDLNNGEADAEDVTGHVPQYIPGRVRKMAASTHEDVLCVTTDVAPSRVYTYKYYWNGDQKLQSSWSEWEFPGVDRVVNMEFIDSQLVLVVVRGTRAYLEVMDIQPGGTDDYASFVCHLDQRMFNPASGTYDIYEDETTITVPEEVTEGLLKCVTAGSEAMLESPGLELQYTILTPTSIKIDGDWTGVPLYFGRLFTTRYRLSRLYIRRESSSGGVAAITEGRLQLLKLLIQYSKTSYFKVEVTPLGRETRSYVSNGRMLGDPNNRTDVVPLIDGSYPVPIYSKNDRVTIELVNDSYLPSSWLSAEWQAHYVQKSKRI